MRIVKLSDLSEDERKKILEEQQVRIETNNQARQQIQQNVNNQFNDLINREGSYDTNKHTYRPIDLKKNVSKDYWNKFKKANNMTLWDSVKETANNMGKTAENTWLGTLNGIKDFQQSLNQAISNAQIDRAKMYENSIPDAYKEEYEKAKNENDFLSLTLSDNLRKEQEEYTKKLQEEKSKNIEKINQNIEEINNPIMKKIAELSPSVGQMAPSFIPGVGAVYASGSAKGAYYDDAKQRGMNDDEADTYSAIMGTVEGLTEMIGVENLSKAGKSVKSLIKGTGKEIAKEGVQEIGKTGVKTILKEYGIGIADNVMQESLIEPIQEVVAGTVGNKANWDNMGQRMLKSGIDGGLVGAIVGGGNLGIQSCVAVIDKTRSGQTPTQQEIKNAVQDASQKLDIKKMIVDSTQQQVNKYKDYNTNKVLDNNSQNWLNQAENIIQKNNPQQINQTNINDKQQVQNTQIDNNQNMSNFMQSAQRNNIDVNNETVKAVEQALNERGIEGSFNADLFTDNNQNAIWRITNKDGNTKREVIFNPNGNSEKTMQNITVHELIHDMEGTKEYDTFKKLILDYNKNIEGYTEARKALENTYSKIYDPKSENFSSLVDQEEVADILGNKLGDQEFVNNLAKQDRTTMQKIYDWVVDKLNKINKLTGYRSEKIFWADVKNKFDNAFNQEYQGNNNGTKYSIQTDNNGNRYVKVDTDQDIFDGINEKDYNKIAKMYIQDYLLGETTLADNDKAVIDKKSANKYTNPGNTQYKFKEKMKLTPELKNALEISEKVSQKLPVKTNSKYSKWEYYKFRFSIGKNNFEGLINIGVDSNGNKHFYEINNIKKTSISETSLNNRTGLSSNNSILPTQENVNSDTQKYSMQESENNSGFFNLKEKQLEIIKKNNPMQDDYHTGIRNIEDIKTFEETLQDSDWADYDEFNPDYTRNMAEDAIKAGKITVYSSYPIEQGTFISPSYMEAESYSGDGKVYSKEVELNDVAWIDPTQGQYAKVENTKYSKQNENWQEYLDKNYKNSGKGETIQQVKMPNIPLSENIKQRNKLNNITNIEEPNIKTAPMNKEKLEETKIAKILTEPVKKQKPKQRTWAIIKANLIDKGAVFEDLSLKTKNRELQSKYDATLSSGAKGQYAIGNNRYIYENGDKTLQSKSLTSIIDEVGDKAGDFQEYMYHQLNIDRMTLEERFSGDTGINYERKDVVKNKPVFGDDVNAEYSRNKVAEYENKYPEFKLYAQDVYDYLDANKKELVDNGVISQELSDKFKEMYPHYVPIARTGNNNNSIQVPLDTQKTGVNSPIKRAKGGSQDIQPLFNTLADKTMQTYRASARNSFGVELKNTLEQNSLLNAKNEYTDVDTIMDTITDEQQTGLTEGTKFSNPTFTVFENGEKVTYEINQDMYDALKPQNELIKKFNTTVLSKGLNKVSNLRRGILTEYNPLFSITNAIKDIQDVLLNSQHATKTYMKFPEAYAQIVKKGYWYNEYIQNGGEQNSYFKDGEFELENNKSKVKKTISMPLEAISKINNVIEMAPRLSEYIASREQGRSVETSMLDASRVTTNFKAGGDITKALNRNGATFLNAGVQGMAQQVRNIREAHSKGLKGYAVLAGKAIIAGMPAILLNNFVWDDDDDYDELQDYVKDNYYVVGKIGDNQFIRIPKGRTTAVIQKLISNVDQYVSKDKELNIDNFAEDFWGMLSFTADNIAPNNPIDNNVISPIVQVAQNKSWYGEDIVPSRLQDVPNAEQYDETTDEFSKWVGKILNISPMKINYLLDQYGGGVSDVLLPLGTPQAENNPIEDKFTTNSIIKNKNPGEFYDKLDKLKTKSNSLEATDEDTLKYKYMSGINEEMGKLYKQKREEQNSSDDDKTKKQKVQDIQNQINELAKKGLNDVDNFKINTTTATVGSEKYYKNISVKTGEESWEKLSKEEIEKNKNISLETYASFKRKVAQETIAKRKSGELTEKQDLKNVDKTKIILDSNCSDKEKLEVYKKYIGTEDKKVQLIDKLGFPIKGYLNYKTYNFESDKDEEGESISGSKKTKVVSYLKSISDSELSLDYKQIIAKIENISEFDNDIVKFIDNKNNLTKDEKKELLEIIGFKVDKDGYVQTTSMIPIKKYVK